jgi:ribulose-5-phosphate 4-epimerase/fuculose-1-phosphate aldolase
MLASLASVSISVTNVLAVETSERVVHRAMMTRVPEALEATLHPHATCAVAKSLLHKVMSAREAGRVMPERVVPGDLREAVNTIADTEQIARRVLGCAHPLLIGVIEKCLRRARGALRARETQPRGA